VARGLWVAHSLQLAHGGGSWRLYVIGRHYYCLMTAASAQLQLYLLK
jgi:hypothetical protein